MHAERQIEAQLSVALRPRQYALLGVIALCLVLVFAWHGETFAAMAATWWRTETFAHGLIVLPIFAWLVWRDRARLIALRIAPYPPALLALAAAGFVWMLGELSATVGVSQFAMVAMVPCALCALLGRAALRALAFPLAFLFFAVPFGAFMLPWLMQLTADFTVGAVRLSGVPVYREGMLFHLPSGSWSVVEACSGLRYLIASVMVGTLYAYLTYRSPRRRLLFLGVAIAVPLVANWLRAYFIVMLGHLSDNRLAAGVDHLIYGWVFFGVVMAIMFWIGTRWREDLDDTAPAKPAEPQFDAVRRAPRHALGVALAVLLLIGVWKPTAAVLSMPQAGPDPMLQPLAGVAAWQPEAASFTAWTPPHDTPAATLDQQFRNGDAQVGMHVAYYRNQSAESEAVRGESGLLEGPDAAWRRISARHIDVDAGADPFSVMRAEFVHPLDRIVAWRWYWIDGRMTSNAYVAKAQLAWAKLRGASDDSAVIVLYTPRRDASDDADRRLADFLRAMSPALLNTLHGARGGAS